VIAAGAQVGKKLLDPGRHDAAIVEDDGALPAHHP
jgi:hypothetical protein